MERGDRRRDCYAGGFRPSLPVSWANDPMQGTGQPDPAAGCLGEYTVVGSTRLVRALLQGNAAAARGLLACHPETALSRWQGGFTPLHAAAVGGCGEVIPALLEAGADTQAVLSTPYDYAGLCDLAGMPRGRPMRLPVELLSILHPGSTANQVAALMARPSTADLGQATGRGTLLVSQQVSARHMLSGHILLSSQEVEVRLLPRMAKSPDGETLIVATDLCRQEWKFALTAFVAAGETHYAISGALPFLRAHRASPGDVFSLYQLQRSCFLADCRRPESEPAPEPSRTATKQLQQPNSAAQQAPWGRKQQAAPLAAQLASAPLDPGPKLVLVRELVDSDWLGSCLYLQADQAKAIRLTAVEGLDVDGRMELADRSGRQYTWRLVSAQSGSVTVYAVQDFGDFFRRNLVRPGFLLHIYQTAKGSRGRRLLAEASRSRPSNGSLRGDQRDAAASASRQPAAVPSTQEANPGLEHSARLEICTSPQAAGDEAAPLLQVAPGNEERALAAAGSGVDDAQPLQAVPGGMGLASAAAARPLGTGAGQLADLACEVCHSPDNEATMLLCDSCDAGYHMTCLTPPLSSFPEGHWFCARCSGRPEKKQRRAAAAGWAQCASFL